MYDGQDIHEPDVMIDDHEIPTSSQSMTNELFCMDLNDSFSERRNSISLNRNLKQSSISNYFTKNNHILYQFRKTNVIFSYDVT